MKEGKKEGSSSSWSKGDPNHKTKWNAQIEYLVCVQQMPGGFHATMRTFVTGSCNVFHFLNTLSIS
jgi:hypothetical protein